MVVFSRSESRSTVVGHRGVRRSGVMENSPHAFGLAAGEGAEWVELDVRRCGDGVPVLYHNSQTPDGQPLLSRTAAQLGELFGVCTFAEALAGMPQRLGVNIEVKNLPGEPDYDPGDEVVALIADEIRRFAQARPVLLSSFNPLTVQALREQHHDLPVGLITYDAIPLADAVSLAQEFGANAVCPRVGSQGLDPDGVAAAHDAGFEVMVWTVNDTDEARRLSQVGVDAICSDDPKRLRAALET